MINSEVPMHNDTVEAVLDSLHNTGLIPTSGKFEITDSIIDVYCQTYRSFKRTPGSKYKADSPSNIRFTRKAAGVVLTRLLEARLVPVAKVVHDSKLYMNTKSGFVYVISNPAFEGFYKVGMTTELNKRLQTYQTYDPHRRYKIEHNVFVSNRAQTERRVLDSFGIDVRQGEWVQAKRALEVLGAIVKESSVDTSNAFVVKRYAK